MITSKRQNLVSKKHKPFCPIKINFFECISVNHFNDYFLTTFFNPIATNRMTTEMIVATYPFQPMPGTMP